MEETKENLIPSDARQFLGHVNPETKKKQFLSRHLEEVERLAEKNCPLESLKSSAKVIGISHDSGKFRNDFLEYMEDILKYGETAPKRKIDHSSAGGLMIEDIAGSRLVSWMAGTAVFSHHGLCDCVDLETGETLAEKRRAQNTNLEEVKERFFQIYDRKNFTAQLKAANKSLQDIYNHICRTLRRYGVKEGGDFYLGMYQRLLLSLLIDSDWSDAASFSEERPVPEGISGEQRQEIWSEMIGNYTVYMRQLTKDGRKSALNRYRSEISDLCFQAAQREGRCYWLTVPTGAGKTLSSLRFALYHAQKYKKKRIFYAAPFNSILTQNAKEIRTVLKDSPYILEHHCNVQYEDQAREEEYKRLTENWGSSLIVITSAVQLLNTLFSGQKSSIRRMHSLCHSVIIFDEVQAIPVRCTELFHLAVNFLSQFCNTTVILCSATQPSLAKLRRNNLLTCEEMVGDAEIYSEAFRRVEIENKTGLVPGGMSIEQLKDFTLETFETYRSVLIIVNTRGTAYKLYEALEQVVEGDYELFHLSRNMCPQNLEEELKELNRALDQRKQVICVSTQLVEAGIDFSFACVIRSLAGLDSIIQAAGRCNRHKEMEGMGKVYIVKLSSDAENTGRMKEMTWAQTACERLLYEFEQEPELFGYTLTSQASIRRYYELYFHDLEHDETKFPVPELETTLVDLLGENKMAVRRYWKRHGKEPENGSLNQAFRTAGETFEVIAEESKISVVIPYDKTAKRQIEKLEDPYGSISEQKTALRILQRYTVGISLYQKDKLKNAVYAVRDLAVLILNEEYYDRKKGILEEPQHTFLNF